MAVIWGLDLKEIKWSKFKSSYMWNNEYHLRRTKFIIYQLAMIFCVVSESLGTAALAGTLSHPLPAPFPDASKLLIPCRTDYVSQQDFVESRDLNAHVHNDDFIGIASYNIFVGIFVATIFGAAFFFDLFWPERYESPDVKLAWRICSVLAALMALSSALALTIIVACHSSYVTGIGRDEAKRLLEEYGGSPLVYKHNGRAVASVVFLWPGTVFAFAR